MTTRLTLRKDNTLVHQDPKTGENKTVRLTTDQIKELGLQTVKLRPDIGDEYWYINTVGSPIKGIYELNVDADLWDAGNGFFTEAEAIKESKRRKAERLIKNYKLEFDDVELDWSNEKQNKYFAIYNQEIKTVLDDSTGIYIFNTTYFSESKFIYDSEEISGGKITKQVWLDYLGVA